MQNAFYTHTNTTHMTPACTHKHMPHQMYILAHTKCARKIVRQNRSLRPGVSEISFSSRQTTWSLLWASLNSIRQNTAWHEEVEPRTVFGNGWSFSHVLRGYPFSLLLAKLFARRVVGTRQNQQQQKERKKTSSRASSCSANSCAALPAAGPLVNVRGVSWRGLEIRAEEREKGSIFEFVRSSEVRVLKFANGDPVLSKNGDNLVCELVVYIGCAVYLGLKEGQTDPIFVTAVVQ